MVYSNVSSHTEVGVLKILGRLLSVVAGVAGVAVRRTPFAYFFLAILYMLELVMAFFTSSMFAWVQLGRVDKSGK